MPDEDKPHLRRYDLIVKPLNSNGIPLFYIYQIKLFVDTGASNYVSVISAYAHNNMTDFLEKGFKFTQEPDPNPSGETTVSLSFDVYTCIDVEHC